MTAPPDADAPCAAGARIGDFEIVNEIGRGGMGILYRARDLRLDREVALKRPLPGLRGNEEFRRRFLREARAASKLSHPNVVSVLETFEVDECPWLVLQLIEGPSLADVLARSGKLPVATAARYGLELASALQAAHAKGIIHRDVNPRNILVTADDRVMLTDFGLARTLETVTPNPREATEPLTTTDRGTVMGTPRYMSPEQARGEAVDARTDIFSLGAVLYEMCTGTRAFPAKSESELFGAILTREPAPISAFTYEVPSEFERVIRKCLAKRLDERYQDARDLVADLTHVDRELEFREYSDSHEAASRRGPSRISVWWAVAPVLTIALAAIVWRLLPHSPSVPDFARARPFQVTSSEAWEGEPRISPDGTRVAYVSDAEGNLEIYVVGTRGGVPLRLTDDPATDSSPRWFPDGSAIAFVSDRGGGNSIWKMGQLGGAPTLLIEKASGPAISQDGSRIAFERAESGGYSRIAVAALADPGTAEVLTGEGDGRWSHESPTWSPDGRNICYAAFDGLWVYSFDQRTAHRLTRPEQADENPFWSPDGTYVYFSSWREETRALWRVRPDGEAPERVTMGAAFESYPSLSAGGTRLAYASEDTREEIVLRDVASGRETTLPGFRRAWMPALAADASLMVFVSDQWSPGGDLWVQPLADGGAAGPARQLTSHDGSDSHPAFSPDGKWIAYYRIQNDERDIWVIPVMGGTPIRFTDDPAADLHPAWSPDGSHLAFCSERGGTLQVWMAAVRDGRPTGDPWPLTPPGLGAQAPAWSPDGSRIAFAGSNMEAFVGPAVEGGRFVPVTAKAEAERVRWDPTGSALIVCGRWGGRELSLRRVPLDGSPPTPVDPPVDFGSIHALGLFDLSTDGRLLAWCRSTTKGDVWVLDARSKGR